MRKIDKDFAKIPPALQTQFYDNEAIQTHLLAEKSKHRFDKNIYNKAIITELLKLYHYKCAFCECKFVKRDGQLKHAFCKQASVEHFRPKSEYYWLAYEWSNLFLTCQKCNENKGNDFELINAAQKQQIPLVANKIDFLKCKANCAELLAEEACFLHPEMDKVEDFFTFERTGKIVAKTDLDIKNTRRANYTSDKTKLNRSGISRCSKKHYRYALQ